MNAAVPQVQPDPELGSAPDETAHETAQETGQAWFQHHFEHEDEAAEPASPQRSVVGGFLIGLALLWTGAVAWAAGQAAAAGTFGATGLIGWVATASGPLALIGLGWLLFGRSSRGETVKFTRSIQAMRAESESLQAVLGDIAQRLGQNRVQVAEETNRLMHLGEEASARLGAVTRDVDAGAQAMARYADQLDRAAGSARTDMGVLLADLPRAEAQTRSLSELLRSTGVDAHAQAQALEAQIGALALRARDADDAVSGAAGRLTAHVAQVESAAATATGHLEQATASMNAGVDGTLARAAEAIEATRHSLDEQGRTMLATVEQSRAAAELASEAAVASLNARFAELGAGVEALAARVADQDRITTRLIEAIGESLGSTQNRLTAITIDGETRLGAFGATAAALQTHLEVLMQTASESDLTVGALAARSDALKAVLAGIGGDVTDRLPAGMDDLHARAERSRALTESLAPQVEALGHATGAAQAQLEAAAATAAEQMEQASGAAHKRLAEAESLVARQGGALDALVARQDDALETLLGKLDGGVETMRTQVGGLSQVVAEADLQAEKLARDTGPLLIEALLRVREAAMQATERAREAIATAIPDAAARLGDATGAAMHAAITDQVSTQMAEMDALTAQAVDAARAASERLTRQMLAIGETTAAVEARIAEGQESLRENEHEQFSRRVALLIESLNSTSIDVAKILSNDVTDNAWAQYLKGDRGVFTRRAVRLLDNGEAREIVRHYEAEPEFREQVNRYVHDFEALLRRVLAEPDGSPLSVTLLSSDVGKLYVALAQGIERIRT